MYESKVREFRESLNNWNEKNNFKLSDVEMLEVSKLLVLEASAEQFQSNVMEIQDDNVTTEEKEEIKTEMKDTNQKISKKKVCKR